MNYDNDSKFLTLTFRDNITDIEVANNLFNKFIKRLKYYLKEKFQKSILKYIATWEIQEKRKETTGLGVIHYHIILFSFPYINANKLETIWNHGFIKINKIKSSVTPERVGLYISKYFTKNLSEKATKKKAVFTSRNLEKPFLHVSYHQDISIAEKVIECEDIAFTSQYVTRQFVNEEWIEDVVNYYVIENKDTKKVEHSRKEDLSKTTPYL
ncbi:hypothetical protein HBP99_07125 [Listeria booriae]|uniref:Replication-associated protein ORF2/G2P domain-containing protein n=1 Tax=Listeria booriae TaxID=1552123 RepID=A0A7X1DQ12_9LIST|nr:hypothetical protein [Listeria booriae]MBC1227214.1 hypothetical protein [Listeria booriae]MBC2368402.1 hypothetical protein [Listeria booriae]MBC2370902.1 hypothetical protein [Listeria booriae]